MAANVRYFTVATYDNPGHRPVKDKEKTCFRGPGDTRQVTTKIVKRHIIHFCARRGAPTKKAGRKTGLSYFTFNFS
ncbi:MAG: hypothetical protein DRP66_05860 [Planctomycetota bacterium]|nr:MAG: hypothetical protein DRP66_05860 [Planctomycetota bacterium]